MPSKNVVKIYIENGYYHAYNRGVEKRIIFEDDKDYRVFLNLLKAYLSPENSQNKHPLIGTNYLPTRIRVLKSFYGQVVLISYCLMPNHFHFLLKQTKLKAMAEFMKALCTTYSMYFNKRYGRVGTLFQGTYKAVNIETEPYLLHLSRYIHLNPDVTGLHPVSSYRYSSYPYYLGTKNAVWVKPDEILGYFKTARSTSLSDCLSYQSFVEDYKKDSGEILGDLVIEKD